MLKLRFFSIFVSIWLSGLLDCLFLDILTLYFIEYFIKQAFDMLLSEFFLSTDIFSIFSILSIIWGNLWLSFLNNLVSHAAVHQIISQKLSTFFVRAFRLRNKLIHICLAINLKLNLCILYLKEERRVIVLVDMADYMGV